MNALTTVQGVLLLIIAVAAFGVNIYAFVDALRARADAYAAAGKLTKPLWSIITGVAAVFGFIFMVAQLNSPGMPVFSIINIVAFVASCVYLFDVRPAVRRLTGGNSGGPYGGW